MKKIFIIMTIISIANTGCEERLNIENPDEIKLAVEGSITDELKNQIIKLSTTSNFNSGQRTPKLSGASVWIEDWDNTVYTFSETVISGEYWSDELLAGVVDNSYKLYIETFEGDSYESDYQLLKASPPIESITFKSRMVRNPDELKYFVTAHLTDPASTGDYYRWKAFKNGKQIDTIADLVLRSDRLFNSNPFNVEFTTFPFDPSDKCTIEQFSLTEETFDFFRLLQIQAGELGESTSTSPSQVEGNVRNINNPKEVVLGFFYATSIQSLSVTITE
ncbi:MAG: DUF4249 domain-containing protein [Bacteroidetes bacterium]|nr:DUF4249 domain-containing protein [Bacteroidota bacterium]MDA1120112.1 DUF4249 domain-containing protein [Bacteroidota bacterium]